MPAFFPLKTASLTRLALLLLMITPLGVRGENPAAAPAPDYDWQSKTLPEPQTPATVRVNSIGFAPADAKLATVTGTDRPFRIRNLDTNQVALSGTSTGRFVTAETDTGGEILSTIDLTAVATPGLYAIEVDGTVRSAPFHIGKGVWNESFKVVTRGMYLWRCGVAVDGMAGGKPYHHDACHLEDGYLDKVGGPAGTRINGNGGWHDAGDYNKYVVNAGVTVGLMFKAWEQFRPSIERVNLEIPESGKGLPDFLAELKFEYDWLFSMQAADGRVYHKLSAENFGFWGPPDKDTSKRYLSPWSTSATADFAAMMALGARHFREFDVAYADRCLAAATSAWKFLEANPENHDADQSAFHTGQYPTKDPTHRLWAAVELWETTGSENYRAEFEKRAKDYTFTESGPNWGDARDLALGTYLLSKRTGRDESLVKRLRTELVAQADAIVAEAKANAHARPFGGQRKHFSWGCNSSVAGQTYLLQSARLVSPKEAYHSTSADALAHLFGRNYHGRSYVTGLGYQPPEFTHDRRGFPQLPGYLVGGPWPTARHWFDQWKDPSRNEIAINWNGALIYALAAFVE